MMLKYFIIFPDIYKTKVIYNVRLNINNYYIVTEYEFNERVEFVQGLNYNITVGKEFICPINIKSLYPEINY